MPAVAAHRRQPQEPLLAGVCAAWGARFGVDPLVLRIALIALTLAGGVGIAIYIIGIFTLPSWRRAAAMQRVRRPGSWQIAAGTGLVALAALLALRQIGLWSSDALVWPVVLGASGAALIWRQSVGREDARPAEKPHDPVVETVTGEPAALPHIPRSELYRGGFGIALIAGAALLVLQAAGALSALRDAVLTIVVVVAALVLMLAPFVWRLARNLNDERSERIRSQERAEVAAHLHDSVLQTLALVQRQADDPRAVLTLARRQERELRAWLTGDGATGEGDGLRAALKAAAERVEEDLGVPIDLVAVGDLPRDERVEALVAAAREAMLNAARFAGDAGPVAVYAEAGDGHAQVFVRDRGPGFDPDAVPVGRHGVRESIVGRMTRHGGRATVRGVEGGGTEVELTL